MENTFGAFMFGCLVGIIITIILIASALSNKDKTIKTYKRLTPEWELTTDGKKVDTLYIYKQK